MNNYDGDYWGHNGPNLLTRLFRRECKTFITEMPLTCSNFTMLQREKCYAIDWREWQKFFNIADAADVMNKVKDSYFVHFWNHLNADKKLSKLKDANTAYMKLAEKFCPEVVAAPDDFF